MRLRVALAACAVAYAVGVPAADEAFVRASAGILQSRNMSVKDRVEAADALARHAPQPAVPLLIDALNDPAEPVRRAAARGLRTIAREGQADDAAAARAAMPALRTALNDPSIAVAMYAADALEALGEPNTTLADARRKALRTSGPYSYERFLAARGLTTAPSLRWLGLRKCGMTDFGAAYLCNGLLGHPARLHSI